MQLTDTYELTRSLIQRASVTPLDEGCQDLLKQRLQALDFRCETIVGGPLGKEVTNLWAKREGKNGRAAKTLVWAGHTDVVPPGPLDNWLSPPFEPTIYDDFLFGRGAADMKSSIAAFVTSVESFLSKHPDPHLSLAFLITSDEEGPTNLYGSKLVCEKLKERGEQIDFCIVGEPTSSGKLGDTIKNGRRGSMAGKLIIKGIQGHVAYPHLARNPIHQMAPVLQELVATTWDDGNEFFPPTTFQISNIHGGAGALNVIPGEVVLDLNFRFSTMSTPQSLQTRFEEVLRRWGLEYEVVWNVSGLPFLTSLGPLLNAVKIAIKDVVGVDANINTKGGTSDGRFLFQICSQVIEFGPCNTSIHKVNECIKVADLEPLSQIYCRVMELLNEAHEVAGQ